MQKLNKSGFTLIEILVSLAILSLIITGITIFSIQTIEAHTRSRAMQNAIENARFAIEGLSKRIRTSHRINGDINYVTIIDNVNDTKTYTYEFVGGKLTMNGENLVGGDSNIQVSGNFYIRPTVTNENTNNRRGFVRISMTITYDDGRGNPTEKDSVTIRSGVSLRDYGEDIN